MTLLHNEEAGFEDCTTAELLGLLHDKGYGPVTQGDKSFRPEKDTTDLLVLAGGDGTIAKYAKQLVGSGIPIGILPLGTANNIATALDIKGTPRQIIENWDMTRRKFFDAGWVKGPEDEQIFLESVGFGLFPRLIRQREGDEKEESREEELADALLHQLEILDEYEARFCKISMDDQESSGRYLMIEVMNIRFAGPNMRLVPQADPGDGMLDVTLVREEDRDLLADFLKRSFVDKAAHHGLRTVRAKNLSIEWHGPHFHVDDEAHEAPSPLHIHAGVKPRVLEFLC